MKTVKQLLRQPLKTCIGIVLLTLAAATVCLCLGQALAARTTKETLDQRFSSIGIPLVQEDLDGAVHADSFLLDAETLAWVEKMAQDYPDIVKQMARHGILSAYIPELKPLNPAAERFIEKTGDWYTFQSTPENGPQACAMLVITLEEISEPQPITEIYTVEKRTIEDFPTAEAYYEWLYTDPETEKITKTLGYSFELTGRVTDVVALPEGYLDPIGRVARLTYTAPTPEAMEALALEPGKQYIVYGMDYVDQHWKLAGHLNPEGLCDAMELEHYDPAHFRFLTEGELKANAKKAEIWPQYFSHLKELICIYHSFYLTKTQFRQLNTITMTLDSPVPLLRYEEIRDEQTGELLDLQPQTQITYTDAKGRTVTCSLAEYTARYQYPNIAPLKGSVEDFLESGAGADWQEMLRQAQVNSQVFTVIGVDNMDYLADFSLGFSLIVNGRNFTPEEAAGSRVCILHESLADANGLSVGDTITLNLYTSDRGLPYQQNGPLNPTASFYFSTTPFTETAEFTIVGLWRAEELWPDVENISEYAFSPNTVFLPKAAVQTPMEESRSIVLNSLVLQNGKIEAFHALAKKAGYAGRFKYSDQDYSTVAANFHNYEALAQQMLTIGALLYSLLLLLFLLLFPGSQRGNIRTMHSFGAGFSRCFGHIMVISLCIVIPGSLLGGWLGNQLWGHLVAALQASAESAVALELQPGSLAAIAGIQLLFALVLTVCTALFLAVPRGISSRR